MKLVLVILMLFCCVGKAAFAQEEREKEFLQLKKLFGNDISRASFRDTNMTYMFAFKVEVEKSHDGIIQVKNISASDSSAYLIYENTDFLRKINYSFWLGKRNSGVFVFPVSIFLEYSPASNAGGVDSKDVAEKLMSYLYFTPSGNEPTENYIYISVLNMRTSSVVSE